MKVDKEAVLKIEITGDNVDRFKSAIKKINDQNKKVGFKSDLMSIEESQCISDLNDKIK